MSVVKGLPGNALTYWPKENIQYAQIFKGWCHTEVVENQKMLLPKHKTLMPSWQIWACLFLEFSRPTPAVMAAEDYLSQEKDSLCLKTHKSIFSIIISEWSLSSCPAELSSLNHVFHQAVQFSSPRYGTHGNGTLKACISTDDHTISCRARVDWPRQLCKECDIIQPRYSLSWWRNCNNGGGGALPVVSFQLIAVLDRFCLRRGCKGKGGERWRIRCGMILLTDQQNAVCSSSASWSG